ncbi:MAG: PRC and DUF2382 domain-containing protein [Actinomycetota bacterium]|nr:PRC and DUF2382 domain-containing protein [Actinomycetota bacterium]
MISTDQVRTLLDNSGNVVGDDGSKIGNVGQVYLDDQTGEPEWVTVKSGMFGTAESFVPLAQANARGEDLQVPYGKDKVKGAPRVEDQEGHLTQDQEAELYRYYGLEYTEAGSDSGLPTGEVDQRTDRTDEAGVVGQDTSGPTTDEAMIRSEEQVRVGTERRETGRARLRKYVVTENVTQTVPVSREEVRVEHEPITDANRDQATSGAPMSEEEHELTLHEERPVVDKETVPVERVRMDTETVTGEQQVSEEVRKEQIEADGPDSTSRT